MGRHGGRSARAPEAQRDRTGGGSRPADLRTRDVDERLLPRSGRQPDRVHGLRGVARLTPALSSERRHPSAGVPGRGRGRSGKWDRKERAMADLNKPLWQWSACELAEAVAARRVTAVE